MNVAETQNGGTATASTTYSSAYDPSGAINGLWAGGWGDAPADGSSGYGGWNSHGSGSWPQTLDITFAQTYQIEKIIVVTLQDVPATSNVPTAATTFSTYGITDFLVQTWNGTAWVTIPGGTITGNNKVVNSFTLSPPISTNKVRVSVSNAMADEARITEVEAWSVESGGSSKTTAMMM